jgi:signal transduction histidine kinase
VIVDDGRGFDTAQETRRDSFGLTSMRERAEGAEGELRVRSTPGAGTTVEVVLPNGKPEPLRAPRS